MQNIVPEVVDVPDEDTAVLAVGYETRSEIEDERIRKNDEGKRVEDKQSGWETDLPRVHGLTLHVSVRDFKARGRASPDLHRYRIHLAIFQAWPQYSP